MGEEEAELARAAIGGDGLLESVFRLGFVLKQAKSGCGFLIGVMDPSTDGAKVCKTVCGSMLQKGA
jgi:hypothetical protein